MAVKEGVAVTGAFTTLMVAEEIAVWIYLVVACVSTLTFETAPAACWLAFVNAPFSCVRKDPLLTDAENFSITNWAVLLADLYVNPNCSAGTVKT